jgi:hypothetical protein
LFVVMVYVYPLKFVFTNFMAILTGIQPANVGRIRNDQVGELFVIYGAGFIAVFVILALMNLRALTLADKLQLNAEERLRTRAEIARCLGIAAVGLVSIVLALAIPGGAAGLAGIAYSLIGAVEFVVGYRLGRALEKHPGAAAIEEAASQEIPRTNDVQ